MQLGVLGILIAQQTLGPALANCIQCPRAQRGLAHLYQAARIVLTVCFSTLLQTCMGKDVTLHVSASNPAMLLYQKFGFKTEEYVLDFYDKYYPLESTECKHAFFLRLRR